MSINYCEICKEFIYSFEKEHKCKPMWLCAILDDEDMPNEEKDFCYKIYARGSEEAAEKCADEQDPHWDHSFVDYGGVSIDVKNPKTEEIEKFYVNAEIMIEYSANKRK